MLKKLKKKFKSASQKTFMTGLGTLTLVMGGFNLASSASLTDVQDKKKRVSIGQKRLEEYSPAVTRPLTGGEVRLAKSLFGSSLDLSDSKINLYLKNEPKFASYAEPRKAIDISIYGEDLHSDDYSLDDSDRVFGAFVQKLTHLWQNQQEGARQNGVSLEQTYTLVENKPFTDYGLLQQASIMEDYARRFLDSQDHRAYWMEKTHGAANCSADPLLIDVVERQFPAAGKTRRALDSATTRRLTHLEEAFAKAFFGDEITTGEIRIHASPRVCKKEAATIFESKEIYFWGPWYHANDYVLGDKPVNLAFYTHEIMHAVQGQATWARTNWQQPNGRTQYLYPVNAHKWAFDDYGIEQQAALVEDYTRYFLTAEKKTHWLAENGIETADTLIHLRQVVENRFPGAQKLCRAFEKGGKAGMLALLERNHPKTPAPATLALK